MTRYEVIKKPEIKKFFSFKIFRIFPVLKKKGNIYQADIKNILDEEMFGDHHVFYDFTELSIQISKYYIYFMRVHDGLKKKIRSYKGAVSSVLTFPEEVFLAHLVAKNNLPLFVWQHGEKGQAYDETILFTELLYASDYLMYADQVGKEYKEYVGTNYLDSLHPVGSIGKIIESEKRQDQVILYATGKWFHTATPYNDDADPDRRLYKAHRDILEYLNNSQEEVVFKANNTRGMNTIPYQNEYENIKFEFDTPFTEILKKSKIVILDTPATTLIESCSTEVPIFVLSGRCYYRDDFLETIKERVVWCEDTNELLKKVDLYLKEGLYDAKLYDKSYLEKYILPPHINNVPATILTILNNKII